MAHAVTHRSDSPNALRTRSHRQLGLRGTVAPLQVEHVGWIDRKKLGIHDRLASAWRAGIRLLHQLDHLIGPPKGGKLRSQHVETPLLPSPLAGEGRGVCRSERTLRATCGAASDSFLSFRAQRGISALRPAEI